MNGRSSDSWAFGRPHRPFATRRKKVSSALVALTAFFTVTAAAVAYASSVDVAVVDVTAPTGSVTLAPGGSGSITINMSVTGRQDGTATFEVYRDWSLSGGSFSGSNPQQFTVAARAATDPATTFSTSGAVSVAAGQADGTFTLAVGVFDITNTNTTGAKLSAGSSSNYQVTVETPAPSDTTPPVITPNVSGTLGLNGWYTSDVTVTWTVVDNESAISSSSGCDPTTISTDTVGTTLTCTATSDGGTSSESVTIKRDATPPTITDAGFVSGTAGDNGWYVGAVTNGFSASDATSGLADCSSSFSQSSGGAEGSAVKISSGPCSDNAGNTNPGIDSAAYKIDLSDPTVTCESPAPTFLLNQSGAQVSATVTDSVSGPAASPVYGAADTSSVGSKSVSVTGYDNAGRSTTVGCSYNVIYNFAGFFKPVDNLPTFNSVKAGSAVPVKFSLGGNQGLNILAAGSPASKVIACDSTDPVDAIEETVTAGQSSLSYDSTTDQYVYVWKTEKAWAGTCRALVVTLIDGTKHQANFKLLK